MAGPRTPSKPTFFWQGLLIVLPVVVLVAVGVFSLRQDRLLAQHEARMRAQAIADDLVPLVWNEITSSEPNGRRPSFQIDQKGQLLFPPPHTNVPTPKPFELTVLNAEQVRLWQTLQSADADAPNAEALLETCEAFIDSNPPDNFAAAAHYCWGLLCIRQNNPVAAAEAFDLVAEVYPDATGESGLPLRPLALMKLFEIEPRATTEASKQPRRPGGKSPARAIRYRSRNQIEARFPAVELEHYVSLDSLCSNFVNHPTPLTPYLLQGLQERWTPDAAPTEPVRVGVGQTLNQTVTLEMQDTIRKWRRIWDEHELLRELYGAAREHLPANRLLSITSAAPAMVELPRVFWFDSPMGLKTTISVPAPARRFLSLKNNIGWPCVRKTLRTASVMPALQSLKLGCA